MAEVPNFQNILSDGSRVFNMDESGFPLSVKSLKALAEKGSKNVYHATTENKTNITILACCNGSGTFMPSFLRAKEEETRKKKKLRDGWISRGTVHVLSI